MNAEPKAAHLMMVGARDARSQRGDDFYLATSGPQLLDGYNDP